MWESESSRAKLIEDGSNDEFKQLLSSLPKGKNFIYGLYQFHGFWYGPHHLQGVLNCQSHFRALDSDILLTTCPKSGTTWLKAILFTLVNRPVNAQHSLTTQNPHDLVPSLEIKLYKDYDRVPDLSTLPSPRLFSTHMPPSALPSTVWDSGCKMVYMCRDPFDMFISLWHFGNKLRDPKDGDMPLEEAFEAICKGATPFGPFWDHILEYWKKSIEMPSRVLFLRYEDVKGDTPLYLRQIAEFLGYPFSEDEEKNCVLDRIIELCSFDHLSNLEVNRSGIQVHSGVQNRIFFRRGKVGDSLNYLTPEMSLKLDNIVKDKFHASGFNYF